MNTKPVINTKPYLSGHMGEQPSGIKIWLFADRTKFDYEGKTKFFSYVGEYENAKKAALEWGRDNSVDTVYLF